MRTKNQLQTYVIIMAESITQTLKDILECPVCFELLHDAKSLSCGHVFCEDCVDDLAYDFDDSKQCPVCRRRSNETSTLIVMNKLVDALACDDEAAGSSNTCDKHQGNEKKFVCRQCSVLVCSECALLDHFYHDFTRPLTIEEMGESVKQASQETENWISQKNDIVEEFRDIRARGLESLEQVKREIEETYQQFTRKIKKQFDKMNSDIATLTDCFAGYIDSKVDEYTEMITIVTEGNDEVKSALDKGLPEEVINAHKITDERLKEELAKQLPSTEPIEKALPAFLAVKFRATDKNQMKKALGCFLGLENEDLSPITGIKSLLDEEDSTDSDVEIIVKFDSSSDEDGWP